MRARPGPTSLTAWFLILGYMIIGLPGGAEGQAICSAPHSAPTITPTGSISTLEPASGWILATLHRARSNQFYSTTGVAQPFLAAGEATTRSVFLTGAVGVAWGLELWAQIPVHELQFDDVTGGRGRTGLGDPRLSVRLGSELFTDAVWPISVRAGVKLPGSSFPVDAQVLPLTEGQTDYEVAVESGWAFGVVPLYVLGWAGYRWRREDTTTGRRPGDERYLHFAVGGPVGQVRLELALEVLDGRAPVQDGVAIPASARRLVQLNPTVGWRVGPGSLELSGQLPLSGRNLPTGAGVGVGYLLTWGSF